jgi:hypothetical protein
VKVFAPSGLEPRTLGRPVRSQSLLRLSYLGAQTTQCHIKDTLHKHRCEHLITSCRPAQPTILLSEHVRVMSACNIFDPELLIFSVKVNFVSLVTGRYILGAQKSEGFLEKFTGS